MTPLTPFVEATTTARPVSAARARVMANCCSGWSVPTKVALLVWTTTTCAPLPTWGTTTSS